MGPFIIELQMGHTVCDPDALRLNRADLEESLEHLFLQELDHKGYVAVEKILIQRSDGPIPKSKHYTLSVRAAPQYYRKKAERTGPLPSLSL